MITPDALDVAPPARPGRVRRSTPVAASRRRRAPAGPLTWIGAVIGAVFAVPTLSVFVRATTSGATSATWSRVAGPLWRTVQLGALVSATTAIVGTALAWLTVRSDLPLRRFWRVALVLPLVLPSFVGAGAFIAGLAPGGIVHDALGLVGIDAPRRFRGLGASWLVLSAFTFPYVMLPVAARLSAVRPSHEESATLLGASPARVFLTVTLPELRSSILGGALLVFLYSLSEFGAVQLLGFDTLTRVVYATRRDDQATSFAAAAILLVVAVVVVAAERRLRGRATPDRRASPTSARPVPLGRFRLPASLLCAAVVSIGLVIPVASLATWTRRGLSDGRLDLGALVEPARNSATVGVLAAVVTVLVVLPIAVATTRRPHPVSTVAAGAVLGGFAVPGLVIALALAVIALNVTGLGWLYQSFALLIAGYVIHFGSQALASGEQAVRAVPQRVREQSRLLDANPLRRALRIDLPMMRPGLLAGGGLVMLATVKELPATLLLAPIGFSTLATDIWSGFGEGFYAATGLASLVLISVSGTLTWLLVLRPTMRRTSRT